jgi:hypothetical protein
MLFGGDKWWFYRPRIRPGDKIRSERMLFDYRVTNTFIPERPRPIAYKKPAAKTEEPRPFAEKQSAGAARLTDVGFLDGKMQRVWRYGHFGCQTGDGRRNLDRAFLWRVRPM